MTRAEWARKPDDYKATRIAEANDKHARHRYRTAFVPGGSFHVAPVFLTDAKRVDPPAPAAAAEPPEFPRTIEPRAPRPAPAADPGPFDAMTARLREGIQIVQADQLFPTPDALACRMVGLASVEPGHRVLEPSAGTGALVKALAATGANVTAVEVHPALAARTGARCADFLACSDLGIFDRIVMNPPFADGQDMAHVEHAFGMLAPGGRLVAVMSAGVLFRTTTAAARFRALIAASGRTEDVPEDSFAESGTRVRTVLVVLERESAEARHA